MLASIERQPCHVRAMHPAVKNHVVKHQSSYLGDQCSSVPFHGIRRSASFPKRRRPFRTTRGARAWRSWSRMGPVRRARPIRRIPTRSTKLQTMPKHQVNVLPRRQHRALAASLLGVQRSSASRRAIKFSARQRARGYAPASRRHVPGGCNEPCRNSRKRWPPGVGPTIVLPQSVRPA